MPTHSYNWTIIALNNNSVYEGLHAVTAQAEEHPFSHSYKSKHSVHLGYYTATHLLLGLRNKS